jgi:hypothetical protein
MMKSATHIFSKAEKILRAGHGMRAIQDCCNLSISVQEYQPQVSTPSLMYAPFTHPDSNLADKSPYQHGGLRFLRIPATVSTKIVVEDRQNGAHKTHFNVRIGSAGMYDLMRCLAYKARTYEAKGSDVNTSFRVELNPGK